MHFFGHHFSDLVHISVKFSALTTHLVSFLYHSVLCDAVQYYYTPGPACAFCFLRLKRVRTFLTQSAMNEISRLGEERAQVEILAVWCLDPMILYVGVFVEPWPGVNVLGAICSIHHMCYPQIRQQGFALSRRPVNDTRGDARNAVDSSHQLCEHVCENASLVTQTYGFHIYPISWPNRGLVCGDSFSIGSAYCSGALK